MTENNPFSKVDGSILSKIQFFLERSFERESGMEPDEVDFQYLQSLANAARMEAEAYDRLAKEASETADQAEMRYQQSLSLQDREMMAAQRNEADNFSLTASALHEKSEELLKYIANYDLDTW